MSEATKDIKAEGKGEQHINIKVVSQVSSNSNAQSSGG